MPLTQTNGKGRTYTELVEEARKLIPGLAPSWTNHNPTDPGIVLIELFAWLTEMVLYRVDRVPLANYEKFLGLLKGNPAWHLPGSDDMEAVERADALETEIRATVLELRKPYRAITGEDYRQLLLEEWPETTLAEILPLIFEMTAAEAQAVQEKILGARIGQHQANRPLPIKELQKGDRKQLLALLKATQVKRYLQHNFAPNSLQEIVEALLSELEKIGRVICVPERDLDGENKGQSMPGHVSVIVIAKRPLPTTAPVQERINSYAPSAGLCAALWTYLDERRLVTTRHHVVKPDFREVTVRATLHLQEDALESDVKSAAEERLYHFFDPLDGGPQGDGWPLGRAIYPSEVYQVLENTPGVDYVAEVVIGEIQPQAHQLVAPELTLTLTVRPAK